MNGKNDIKLFIMRVYLGRFAPFFFFGRHFCTFPVSRLTLTHERRELIHNLRVKAIFSRISKSWVGDTRTTRENKENCQFPSPYHVPLSFPIAENFHPINFQRRADCITFSPFVLCFVYVTFWAMARGRSDDSGREKGWMSKCLSLCCWLGPIISEISALFHRHCSSSSGCAFVFGDRASSQLIRWGRDKFACMWCSCNLIWYLTFI